MKDKSHHLPNLTQAPTHERSRRPPRQGPPRTRGPERLRPRQHHFGLPGHGVTLDLGQSVPAPENAAHHLRPALRRGPAGGVLKPSSGSTPKHPLLNGARAIDLIYTGDADRVLGSHRKPIRRDLHVGAPSRPIDPRRDGRDGAGVLLRGRLAGHQQGPRPAPWFSSSGTLDPSAGIRGALYQPRAQRRANRDWLSAFP